MTLFDAKSGPFYDPWEVLPDAEKFPEIRKRLADVIAFAGKRSPFYRERLAGFDAKNEYPLKDVPFLTSADLRANLPPLSADLLTTDTGGWTVFQSGGTTGTPKTSLFTHAELEVINRCNARGFFATGLSPKDRVANLWAVGGLYMTFVHMNRVLQEYGCVSFPFSNHTPAEFVHGVAKRFGINCFTGITSVVLNTLRQIKKIDPGFRGIDKVYFGGEHIYDADREELERDFGARVVKAPGYGTIDSWYLGYQCDRCDNGTFHAFDDMVYVEILNEDTGKPCPRGTAGMLHVTAFPRRLTPIVRYRVGDRAKWSNEACSCGRTTPLFRLLGRGDDVLRVGYDSVDLATVQALVGRVGGTGAVQMEKRREEGRDRLILRVETQAESDESELKRKIEEAFLNERPSFQEFVKKGSVWPLVVEVFPIGGIPLNPRTGKLVRVIDSL